MDWWDGLNKFVARTLASEGTEMTPEEVGETRREIYRKLRTYMAAKGHVLPESDEELHHWIVANMKPRPEDIPVTEEDVDAIEEEIDSLPPLTDEERRVMEERAREIWARIQRELDKGKP